ncbi:hypothetical protein GCM10025779_00050 [Arthrobacter cryoconiti]
MTNGDSRQRGILGKPDLAHDGFAGVDGKRVALASADNGLYDGPDSGPIISGSLTYQHARQSTHLSWFSSTVCDTLRIPQFKWIEQSVGHMRGGEIPFALVSG